MTRPSPPASAPPPPPTSSPAPSPSPRARGTTSPTPTTAPRRPSISTAPSPTPPSPPRPPPPQPRTAPPRPLYPGAPPPTPPPPATAAGYTANPFLIGADNDNGSFTNFFNGSIDEVTLYNSVLTAGQIASIYGADSAGKCFSAPAPNITGFTPTSGLTGAAVTITGSGFTGTNSVKFNGTSAPSPVARDPQLPAPAPGGAPPGPSPCPTAGGPFTSGGNFAVFTGAADLQVSVSAPPSQTAGIPFNYTIGVTNIGPATAGGVTVTTTIPANESYNSNSTGGPWACGFSAGTLTCTAASLATGAAPNIVVNVTPTAAGSVTNSASITSSSTFDNNSANDSAAAITTITGATADLSIAHSVTPASTATGGTLTWTVATTNTGPATATSLTITDVLP